MGVASTLLMSKLDQMAREAPRDGVATAPGPVLAGYFARSTSATTCMASHCCSSLQSRPLLT